MKTGWRVGSLFGIPFYLDPSWFVILLLVRFLYGAELETYGITGLSEWILGLLMAVLLFSSVLLHELGHSVVALSQGITVRSITLFLFGGIASIEKESKTPNQALQVAIAGPMVSMGLFLVLSAVYSVLPLGDPATFMLRRLALTNLVLALFNMMPGLPLDGGQVLKALIWKKTGSRITGMRWAARTGQVLGWSAIAAGVILYISSYELAFIWLALIGWFGLRNAKMYGRITDIQQTLLALTAADVMRRDFHVVDATLSVNAFIQHHILNPPLPDSGDAPPNPTYFTASDGRYRGQISASELQAIERSQWEQLSLKEVAIALDQIDSVRESAPLPQVIRALDQHNIDQITVLTPADAVAGVIDRRDILSHVAHHLNFTLTDEMIQTIQDTQTYPVGLPLTTLAQNLED